VSARPQRRNSRRTWDDGSGCEHRPLFPHAEGCPGWLWYGPMARPTIERCERCRTFDDHQDAAEHVASCVACLGLIGTAADDEGDDDEPPPVVTGMPPLRRRRIWVDWANDIRGEFDTDAPTLDPWSKPETIHEWLFRFFAPDDDHFEELLEPGSTAADAWWALGELSDSHRWGDDVDDAP
jgi:hypothetical protein